MAPNSTYCPHDRWTLWIEAPHGEPRVGAAVAAIEIPRGFGGLLERRRLEKQCSHLERQLDEPLDKLIAKLDERLEKEPADFEAHRRLGLLTMLRRHYERSNAHFKRAHELNPHDFETHINYALVLAERGQLQPALELLVAARKQWPDTPLVLHNLALVALQARRANVVLDTVEALETLWKSNPAIATEYFVDGMTARGLALLLLNRLNEAHTALLSAARGQYAQEPMGAAPSTQGALHPASMAPTKMMTMTTSSSKKTMCLARRRAPNAANSFIQCKTTAKSRLQPCRLRWHRLNRRSRQHPKHRQHPRPTGAKPTAAWRRPAQHGHSMSAACSSAGAFRKTKHNLTSKRRLRHQFSKSPHRM
jgi:hypothetical protein